MLWIAHVAGEVHVDVMQCGDAVNLSRGLVTIFRFSLKMQI